MSERAGSVRIMIVDDHAVVRSGLERLLDAVDGVEVIATASDGEEAAVAVETGVVSPDIVVMDLSMPGTDGVEATRRVVAARPDIAVVVLTSFSDTARVEAALAAGAIGYQLKDAPPDELINAVRAAAAGGAPLDPRVARIVLDRRSSPAPALSAREIEVLRLVVDGLANKQIARRLGIAERTVKAHLTNIFGRIGVTDRTQAALWAERHLSR